MTQVSCHISSQSIKWFKVERKKRSELGVRVNLLLFIVYEKSGLMIEHQRISVERRTLNHGPLVGKQ